MRVAFYAPMKPPDHPVPSGDRRMARLLMAALERGGHDVVLASRLRSWDDATRPGRQARLRAIGRRTARRLIDRWQATPRPPEAWFTYHLYHKAPDWIGPPVSAALGIPYVVAEASYAAKQAGGHWADGHAASAAAIRRADAVLAMSPVDRQGLERLTGDPARLHRLDAFVDTARYVAAAARRDDERRRWWGGVPGPWLLAVGMMRRGDKLDSYGVLADALGELTTLDWRLALVGDGPARDEVVGAFDPARCRALGACDSDALAGLYAAADLMVWPAINEAYGMAMLEAQATGLPVVAGASGGVPEIVTDGVTGLLAPPGDAAAFAVAVRGLLQDPPRHAAMGRAAAAAAAQRHGIDRAAARLSDILRRVRA